MKGIQTVYDEYQRVSETYGLDRRKTSKTLYHALSTVVFDAADLADGATPHPASVIVDGFGREVRVERSINEGGVPDTLVTQTSYLPTGEVQRVTRSHSACI